MTNVKKDKPAAIGDRAFSTISNRIRRLQLGDQEILDLLRANSQQLAERVYGPKGRMRLREAGRRSGLSAAYLSQVLHGRALSPAAWQRVADLLKGK